MARTVSREQVCKNYADAPSPNIRDQLNDNNRGPLVFVDDLVDMREKKQTSGSIAAKEIREMLGMTENLLQVYNTRFSVTLSQMLDDLKKRDVGFVDESSVQRLKEEYDKMLQSLSQ